MALSAALVAASLVGATPAAPPPDLQLSVPPGRVAASARRLTAAPSAPRARIAALDVALRRAGVDPGLRAEYLGEAWATLRLANRMGGTIGRELHAVIASAATIARRTGFDATRAHAVFLELETNRLHVAAHRDLPPVGARRRLGGITFQRYAGQALRIMPLATFGDINGRGMRGDTAGMLADLDAALALAAPRAGALQIEYLFPYGGGAPPWRSAMASAVAMSAAARAYTATREASDADPEQYRSAALGLFRDVERLARRDGADVWYPLYSFSPGLRVLNGHLQVTISLSRLAGATGEPAAQASFAAAAATATRRLPRYDAGGWSRYSETRDAPLEYHDLQTRQLRELAALTGDATFADFAGRFHRYRTEPPRVDATGEVPAPFYPVPVDGRLDTTVVPFALTKPGRVTLALRDAADRTVDTLSVGYLSSGAKRLALRPNRPLPAGSYAVDVTTVDPAGLRGEGRAVSTVTILRDTTPPRARQVVRRGRRIGWRIEDAETPWVSVAVTSGGRTFRYPRRPLRGSVVLPAPRKGARPGATTVVFRDSSGNALRVVLPAPRPRPA